jgi:hypothetical protein
MLTRLLPIAFDGSHEDSLEKTLFWENTIPEPPEAVEPLLPSEDAQAQPKQELKLPTFDGLLTGAPLAQRILDILVRLMFLPNFTIVPIQVTKTETVSKESDVPFKYAWAPGTFTTSVEYYNQSWGYDNHRMEVVLCLLTTLSRPIYSPPTPEPVDRWLEYFTSKRTVFTPVMFASLLNVALKYDPVGWGVPYNHVLSQDVSEQLMNVSLELLSVLLEYKSTVQLQPAQYQQTPAHQAIHGAVAIEKPADRNIFIDLLERLTAEDHTFIFNGVLRMLNNPVVATNTLLPNSTKAVSCQQEMLTVFWQLIQLSRPFLMHILKREEFIEIVYPVLHFVYQGRKDPAQMGQVHLGIFFLLYLSGEREFSIALNRPFNKSLVIDIPKFWNGTYADYLILVLIQLIVDGQKRLDSLWECMLTILSNVSPYIKTLTMITSTRLLKLSVTLSKKSWLLANEKNHRYIFFILETFNNILQYQFEGNTSLIYSIILYKDHFFKLLEITKPAPPQQEKAPESTLPQASPSASTETASSSNTQSDSTSQATPTSEKSSTDTAQAASSSAPQASTSSSAPALSSTIRPSNTEDSAPPVIEATTKGPQSQTATQIANEQESTFKWTQEWLDSWASRLPISTIIRFLNGITPQIEAIVEGAAEDQDKIVNFLKKTTLVGILPVPHPILIRHYSANRQTHIWFLQYIWGVIFIRHYVELLVFAETEPRLFNARLPSSAHSHAGHKH